MYILIAFTQLVGAFLTTPISILGASVLPEFFAAANA